MTIAAAAMCAAFTSCSHDFDSMSQEELNNLEAEQIVNNYNQAFIKTFGQPAANQDWGFGTTRAYTRTINSGWDGWVNAPADEDFASDYPNEIEPTGDYYKYTNGVRKNYKFDNDNENQEINFWVGNANIYVKGKRNIDFKNPGDGNPGITFYILPGADVTFSKDYSYNNTNNHAMYVSSGAKVTFAGKMSSNVHIYNRGEIVVNDATGPYAQGVIYNEGTITSKKNLSVYNNGAQVVNVGTWNVATGMTVEGSGHFRNLGGTMTITGTTLVNSNECSWINDATFITDYYTYHAGSHDVINNCKLIVNENFDYTIGDGTSLFQIDGGGSVVTKNFYGSGPFKFEMGAKALFKVTNDCYLDATAAGIATNGYGFHGVGNDYAVLQAKNVTNHGNPGHGYVAYGGKLYVSAESHFAQGTAGAADGSSYIIFMNGCSTKNIYAPGFESGKPAITIEETPCNPGFEGDKKNDCDVRIIAEDLNATAEEKSDWDFNDVVFDVKFTSDDAAEVTLIAAGGTLPLIVGVNNPDDNEDYYENEVHYLFGVPVNYMVNTNAEAKNLTGGAPVNAAPKLNLTITGVKASNGKLIPIHVKKSLKSGGKHWFELTAEKGHPASKLAVNSKSSKFTICDEREYILTKYPNFLNWVVNNDPLIWWE